MNIDKKIFKKIIGKDADFSNQKDLMTMIAIHYLLNRNDFTDNGRAYPFDLTSEGLKSSQWAVSIKSRELVSELSESEFTPEAKLIIDCIRYATEKTARDCKEMNAAGPRTIVIAMASLACVRDNFDITKDNQADDKKYFERQVKFLKDLYEFADKGLRRIENRKDKLLYEQQKASQEKIKE